MSIFKQSFPKWVREQLLLRQDLQTTGLSGGYKSQAALTWNQSKQCVVRATSLVDYVQNVNLLENTRFESLQGQELSKKFILQGGILNNGKTRSAPFGSVGSAYGDPSLGSNGSDTDGFGQVPMPGITGLDIATKSAYGSLRQAKLSFVVHNLRQLEIMELLYLRPGYPIYVEWGWDPFINNDGEIDTIDHYTMDESILFPKTDGGKVKQSKVYQKLLELKKNTGGNYDGFLGFVTNFGFNARVDGGFDCYSEIVSMGEALDSLKISASTMAIERIAPGANFDFRLRDTDEEIKNPDILRAILLAMAKFTGIIQTGGAEEEGKWQSEEIDGSGQLVDFIVGVILDKFSLIQKSKTGVALTQEQKLNALKAFILRKGEDTEAGQFKGEINAGYITWQLLVFLINELLVPKTEKNEEGQVKITTSALLNNPNNEDEKTLQWLQYAKFRGLGPKESADVSCNPGVCVLPHTFFDPKLAQIIRVQKEKEDQEAGWADSAWGALSDFGNFLGDVAADSYNAVSEGIGDAYYGEAEGTLQIKGDNQLSKPKDEFMYYIGGIFLNTQMLLDVYDSSVKNNKNADLGDFFKGIWDKVNEACPLHNFIFKIDAEFPNMAYVIDLPVDSNDINEIKDKIIEIEVQSSKSVIREYSLEATIPDALKSTVAIHAQNPETTEDLDDLTFQAFNRAIKNRLYVKPSDPSTSTDTTEEWTDPRTEKEIAEDGERNLNWLSTPDGKPDLNGKPYATTPAGKVEKRYLKANEKFQELAAVYWESLNADDNNSPSDADDKITDLTTTIKELQTAALGLEQLKNKNTNSSAVIPLEFSMTLDGISNIIIGSVFKIRADRLPKAYGPSTETSPGGANVAFIVFKEEQSITAGQDWTTKISGKMIMLPNENQGKEISKSPAPKTEKKAPPPELPPPLIINNEEAVPDNTFVAPPPPPITDSPLLRTPVGQLTTSEAGLNLIKQFEGFESNAYVDPGTGGEPITIGYGTTRYADGRKVMMGDTITEPQAVEELKHHVMKVSEKAIRKYIDVPLTQFEFDSLSSWTYNVGSGNLQASTLRKVVNKGNYLQGGEELLKWNKAAGKVLAGLTRRRVAERNLYLTNSPGNGSDAVTSPLSTQPQTPIPEEPSTPTPPPNPPQTLPTAYTYNVYSPDSTTITVQVRNQNGDFFEKNYSTVNYTPDSAKAEQQFKMDNFGEIVDGVSYPKTGTIVS